MELIDTHTHIYLKDFKSDFQEIIGRAKEVGVTQFYLPSIDSEHTEDMLAIESEEIKLMMGLHPCSVKKETMEAELSHVKKWLDQRAFSAIGEIGIDLHWDPSTLDIQQSAFEQQIDWAIEKDYPIVIHSRNATSEVIEVLKRKAHPRLRGIFHCFGGSLAEAHEIINLGFLLGIGGVVTFKNAGLDKTVKELDLDHLVLETDAPYLSPAPFRGKRNEPSYLKHIATKIAEVKQVSIEEVARVTSINAKKLFR